MITLTAESEVWPVAGSFTISRCQRTEVSVVTVTLQDGTAVGRGESVPNFRYGETSESVLAAIEEVRKEIVAGAGHEELREILPNGGAARCALDCALWDLEAKRSGLPVWQLTGCKTPPRPLVTSLTISLDTPMEMAKAAARAGCRQILKIKLGGIGDIDRIEAIRLAAPNTRLIADANESWDAEMFIPYTTRLVELGFELVEQPFPVGRDGILAEFPHPIPICADESAHTSADLPYLVGRYECINIKLEKTGGLSEALVFSSAARLAGLKLMVGCMLGTSMGMAPAHLVAQEADFVDLDGPLLLARDREHGLDYADDGTVSPPISSLWG